MDPSLITTIVARMTSGAAGLKVIHSVLDSMNRRRDPSREILMSVDGPEEADQIADAATRIVKRIELEEGHSLTDMPEDSIRRYAEVLLAAAKSKAQENLPPADESRARAMLDDMRKGSTETP